MKTHHLVRALFALPVLGQAVDVRNYDQMLRDVRLSLLKDAVYDPRAIKLMKVIRCRVDGARAECSSGLSANRTVV